MARRIPQLRAHDRFRALIEDTIDGNDKHGAWRLAVDDEASIDRARFRAESDATRGGGTAFRKGLRVDRALADDAPVMLAAMMPDPARAVSNVIGASSPAFGECGPVTTSIALAPRCRAAIAL